MKRFLNSRNVALVVVMLAALIAFSCFQEDPKSKTGTITFSFGSKTAPNGRAATDNAAFVLVSIKNKAGSVIYDKKKIELYSFGNTYLSEPIELKPGSYNLTEFIVLDSNGEVIYATPLEGSALAHLVADPLPISFNIFDDQTEKVTPEVLAIDDIHDAEDFGYTTFSFNVVETLSFQLGVFTYNAETDNFELTASNVTVTAIDSAIAFFDAELPAKTNRVTVRKNAQYKLTVSKNGYTPFTAVYSQDSLEYYATNHVLIVELWPTDNSIPTDGLVAEYLFNGNANDSRNNLHGVVTGAVLTADRHGKPNAAYHFDGDYDYILVDDNDLIDFGYNENFSISVWVDISSEQNDANGINDIIRKWVGDHQGYPYCIASLDGNSLHDQYSIVTVRQDGLNCGNIGQSFTQAVPRNKFIHIVYQKDGTTLKTFIDGQLAAETYDPTTYDGSWCNPENNAPLSIGSRGQLARFFTGKIDDIRIYNRPLSGDEIQALYRE